MAGFDLLLWRLILSRWADALFSFDWLDAYAALSPLDIGGIPLEESHVDPLGRRRQHFPTFISDPVDAPAHLFQEAGPLQEDIRPRRPVGKGRLATTRQHFGKISVGQLQLGSDAAPQVGRRNVAIRYRAKDW
jgi:hypothetical protein